MRSLRHASLLDRLCHALAASCLLGSAGCALFRGNPSQANIDLRKQNQALQGRVETLTQQNSTDHNALAAAQNRVPSIQTLPADRLALLFTTHGLKFGRLTGASGDDSIKVYIAPTDEAGEVFKAAGSFDVGLFDLNSPQPTVVGHWTFSITEARSLWRGSFLENAYVLPCPLNRRPLHSDLTLKVHFVDGLTGSDFFAQEPIKVASGSAPATTSVSER